MSLAGSIIKKYKKLFAMVILLFFIFNYYYGNKYEGLSTQSQCSTYTNCADCVKNTNANTNVPCWWSNDNDQNGNKKGCSAFYDKGYSRSCPVSTPESNPVTNPATNPVTNPVTNPATNPASTLKFSSISNCPKCNECPKLTLLNTPTFITQQ